MLSASMSNLSILVRDVLGAERAAAAFEVLELDAALTTTEDTISRAVFAMALNVVLFDDLLSRVPTGAAYVDDVRRDGGRVMFDHGALRTIRFAEGPTGALPPGEEAFTRIFEPLGYRMAGVYPLDRLAMTGRAYAHADLAEAIPQFFLSELHVERFSPAFQAAAHRVFDASTDPLGADPLGIKARAVLDAFAAGRPVSPQEAAGALPQLAAAFGRHHPEPALADYRLLLAESAEAAWIATEGQAFNHATDRVVDVHALADTQRRLGRPMKDTVEVSGSGRVRQTAFKADAVTRRFRGEHGEPVELAVPGSFYEFITRDSFDDEGQDRLDLRFDSANAQGIFKMTHAA